jgi:chromosome segregation ATPase
MSSSIQTDAKIFNGLDKTNSATIRRTFIERGIRPVVTGATDSNSLAITKITKQHQDEKQELQELNTKLSHYLGHVHDLETTNGQLLAEIDQIRQKWGDNTKQLNKTHNPQLRALRKGIDDSLRDQVLQELQLKRFEYDIEHTQQRINAFEDNTPNRLNILQDELNNSVNNLENLKKQFDRNSTELIQQESYLQYLDNEFDGLQIELLNHRLERIMVENELQTLREHAAFQKANYQAQREEILSLSKLLISTKRVCYYFLHFRCSCY